MLKRTYRDLSADEQHVLEHCYLRLLSSAADIARRDQLIVEHHYLPQVALVGEHLRYALVYKGQWRAVATWSSAAFHLKDRDRFIGWTPERGSAPTTIRTAGCWFRLAPRSRCQCQRRGVTRETDVLPLHVIAFETEPGDGCEPANFGLRQFPTEVSHPQFGKLKTKRRGWSWNSFCKTHYASDPRCGGLPNFLRCHLGLVALLDQAKRLAFLAKVSDEGEFWATRSLERLTKEIGEQSAMLASVVGALKNAWCQTQGGAGGVEAPVAGYPNFERLEAEGQRLLPEQLKTMLKALARSNSLRGDAR